MIEVLSDLQERGVPVSRGGFGPDTAGRGRWRWGGPPTTHMLPVSVREVVLQRVGRLSQFGRGLLSLAAVVGRHFDSPLLQTASGQRADTVRQAVDEWLTRRLVEARPHLSVQSWPLDLGLTSSNPCYDFTHDKMRVVVYAALVDDRRRTLHRRVAEALEDPRGVPTGQLPALLAYHWDQADEPGKAAEYYSRAGDHARLVYAHREALDHYRRALVIFKELGRYGLAARTWMRLGLTCHNALDSEKACRACDEGFALQQRIDALQSEPTSSLAYVSGLSRVLRARWVKPATLDLALIQDSDTGVLLAHLFSRLVDLGPALNVVPDVAYAWNCLWVGVGSFSTCAMMCAGAMGGRSLSAISSMPGSAFWIPRIGRQRPGFCRTCGEHGVLAENSIRPFG